jgi:hypothetical protein
MRLLLDGFTVRRTRCLGMSLDPLNGSELHRHFPGIPLHPRSFRTCCDKLVTTAASIRRRYVPSPAGRCRASSSRPRPRHPDHQRRHRRTHPPANTGPHQRLPTPRRPHRAPKEKPEPLNEGSGYSYDLRHHSGADDGNRTRVFSLGSRFGLSVEVCRGPLRSSATALKP